jgi:hypothetical protein
MPDALADARRLIESRLTEIEAEVRQLERALASLGEGGEPGRLLRPSPKRAGGANPAPAKPKRRLPPKRKAAKRAARGQRREELLVAITAAPGARPSELARSIGIKPTQVHALVAKARTEKLIVKRGAGYALRG